MLQAQVHQPTDMQKKQVEVSEGCHRAKGREDIHGGPNFRIGRQRQIDDALDRPLAERLPHLFILALDLVLGWMRRQVDAESSQTRQCAFDCLRVLRLDQVQFDFQTVGSRLVEL